MSPVEKMPGTIKAHIALTILSFFVQLATGVEELSPLVFNTLLVLWAVLAIGLYRVLLGRRSDWARLVLIVITFPWGLLLMTESAKHYLAG